MPEPSRNPASRTGDLWILGEHRLLCGDATCDEDVRRLMNGERAILFATDPPYLVDYHGLNHPTRNKDWSQSYGKTWDDSSQSAELYDGFIQAAVAEAIEPNAAWYCWHASRDDRPDHPTPKPLDAFGIPMRQHVRRGGLCYEPFAGSGSQIIAGEANDRRVNAMEISPAYVDVAVERWQAHTDRAAVLDGDGRTFAEVKGERLGAAGDEAGQKDDDQNDVSEAEQAPKRRRKKAA